MSDETLFGWVHLSDIHFGHGNASHGWDQELVMAALRRDIAARPAPVRVDAVFVTGDIGFSGASRSDQEYVRARAWLLEAAGAAGVGPERVFLVPGNHDVNRDVDTRNKSTGRLMKTLRSRSAPEPLDEALKNADDRKMLASRMAAYLDFAREFGPWAGRTPLPPAEARLFWVESVDGREGLRVRLIGLNTSLLCKDDDDQGQLRLGTEQLAAALVTDRGPHEVMLALGHHPLRKGWLGDEGSADAWIRNHADALLTGHVHEADSEDARSGSGGSFVRVTAGAAHNDQLPAWIPQNHGYNVGEVRRGEKDHTVLRVYPRLWSAPNARFVLDVHTVAEGQRFAEHPLRATLPAAATAAITQPPAVAPTPTATAATPGRAGATAATPSSPGRAVTGPIRIFFSYAPEDDALRKELEKHLVLLLAKRGGPVESFTGRSVGAGEGWRGVVDEQLAEARIILLLVSPDYLASDYCFDVEMEAARQRHEAHQARVIPVVLRDIDLSKRDDLQRKEQWFEKLARVPVKAGEERGKPVTSWPNRDEAWRSVAMEIRREVDRITKGSS